MALVSGVTGNTQLGPSKQDVISKAILEALYGESVIAQTFLDVSDQAEKGAKSIGFVSPGVLEAEERASGTQGTTQTMSIFKDTLDLNVPAHVQYVIDPNDAYQSRIETQVMFAKAAAQAQSEKVDSKCLALLRTIYSNTAAVFATPVDATYARILALRKHVRTGKGKLKDMIVLMSLDQETKLLGQDEFKNAATLGRANIESGSITMIAGMKVIVSDMLTDRELYVYSKKGAAFGLQLGPAWDERKAPEYGAGALLQVVSQLFGVKGLYVAQQGAAAGKTPLVASLNATS